MLSSLSDSCMRTPFIAWIKHKLLYFVLYDKRKHLHFSSLCQACKRAEFNKTDNPERSEASRTLGLVVRGGERTRDIKGAQISCNKPSSYSHMNCSIWWANFFSDVPLKSFSIFVLAQIYFLVLLSDINIYYSNRMEKFNVVQYVNVLNKNNRRKLFL